jgi:hypothetical protein
MWMRQFMDGEEAAEPAPDMIESKLDAVGA